MVVWLDAFYNPKLTSHRVYRKGFIRFGVSRAINDRKRVVFSCLMRAASKMPVVFNGNGGRFHPGLQESFIAAPKGVDWLIQSSK